MLLRTPDCSEDCLAQRKAAKGRAVVRSLAVNRAGVRAVSVGQAQRPEQPMELNQLRLARFLQSLCSRLLMGHCGSLLSRGRAVEGDRDAEKLPAERVVREVA